MSALGFTMDRTMSRESRNRVGKWFAMGDFAWDFVFGMGGSGLQHAKWTAA